MTMKLSNEYCAGFFDGEGCIYARDLKPCIKNGTKYHWYGIRVTIANTNLKVMEAWVNTWGGTLHKQKTKPQHRQAYVWECWSRKVIPLLETMLPYLIVKKPVAEIALELLSRYGASKNGGRHKHISVEEEAIRFKLYKKIHKLNKRGNLGEMEDYE